MIVESLVNISLPAPVVTSAVIWRNSVQFLHTEKVAVIRVNY